MRHLSRRRPLWGTALLLCSFLARSEGMVVFQTNNITLDFPSLPADFGPHIPPEGVSGLLLPADPEDACSELAPPKKGAAPWVALIARSQHKDGCTFDVKVAHAEAAGAVAAVIYDDVYEPLILMAKVGPRHPDPAIPSAFVTQKSGILMRRLLVQGDTVVTLTPLSEALWLSMVMSAAAGFLAVNVVLGALWVIRRQHGGATLAGVGAGASSRLAPPAGLTAAQIRALPIVVYGEGVAEAAKLDGSGSQAGGGASVWDRRGGGSASASTPAGLEEGGEEDGEAQQLRGGSDSGSDAGARGGGTRRVCAICLEGYAGGDKLRVLPCQHRYHSGCIDQWLSGRRPLCPVCKADAHPPPAAVHSEDEEEEEEGEGEGPPSHAAADLESGRAAAAAAAQARRRRRRRRGAAARLLGQLGGGWAALRRTLLGPPAADAGVAVVDGGSEAAEQRQQLLARSRNSSPLPAGSPAAVAAAAASQQPESAATLTNFPAFFPTSMSASGGRRSPAPEIVPEEDAAAGGAVAADAASGSTASPTSSARGGGPCSHLVTVQPDSTEGSETESELE